MTYLDIGIIVAYLVGMLLIGIYASKKQKGIDDYYVAGRNVGAFSLMCLWMSAWIGGASVMGTSSRAYEMGITAIWYVGIIAVGIIVFAFVMVKPIKRLGDKLNNLTFPDFIENRYDSKTRAATTVTTILAYIAYTGSQFVAGASILNVLTGWSLPVCFIVTTFVIVLYTSIGGFLAVTYTDLAQMILLFGGIVLLGVPLAMHHVSTNSLSFSTLPESYFNLGTWGWPTIIALGVSTIFSFFTSMDSYTKCFAAKDEKTARRGTLMAAACVIIIALASTYLGLTAKLVLPDLASSSNSLAALVVEIFPAGVRGLVLVGILAAIMSTGDVCVLTASANITRDIYQRYINPKVEEKKLLVMSIASSFFIGILSAIFAWFNQDIINALFIAFTINSAGLFLPTVCGLFWKRSSSKAAFLSVLSSLIIVVIWYVGSLVSSNPIFQVEALWPAFGISAVIYLIVCFAGKQSPEERKKAEAFIAAKNE